MSTEWCEQKCMALQTVGAVAPAQTPVFLNGEGLDLVGDAAGFG